MLPTLDFLAPAVRERVLLALNHVLVAEPEATDRLKTHVGRRIGLHWKGPTGPWPVPPALALRVTPAGLLEAVEGKAGEAGEAVPDDLRVEVELPAPHRFVKQWLDGERPRVIVEGDAHFAADVAWLAEHLHWDAEHDLAQVIGDAPAHELARLGRAAREALGRAVAGVGQAWSRRPGARNAPPQ